MRHRLADWLLFALVFLAPFGTRQIWRYGDVGGVRVEWGTVSLFGTQILAIAFVVAAAATVGGPAFRKSLNRPVSAAAAVLAAIAAVSSFLAVTGDSGAGLTVASWIAVGWLLVVGILALRPPLRLICWGLFSAAVLQAFLAIGQFMFQVALPSKWLGMSAHDASVLGDYVVETAAGRWLRAYGSFGHPNILGLFLACGVAAAMYLTAVEDFALKRRTAVNTGLKLVGAALLFSLSRSAFLSLLAVILAFLAVGAIRRQRRILLAVGKVFLMVFLGMAAVSLAVQDVALTRLTAAGRLEAQSVGERLSSVSDAWLLFRDRSLLGVGPGQMPAAALLELDDGRSPWGYQPVHNVPMLVATEMGVIGFLAWLAVCLGAAAAAGQRLRFSRLADGVPDGVAAMALSAALLSALATVSLFDHFLWSLWPGQLIFWSVIGLAAAEEREPLPL